jgi:Flp pilus assembly protein TadB
VLARIGRIAPQWSQRRVVSRLDAAWVEGVSLERIMGTKALLFAAGLLAGLSAWPSGKVAALFAAAAMGCAGFVVPDFRLARRAVALRRRVAHDIPSLLDLVAVCATAGLSPPMALERSSLSVPDPLRVCLARVKREVALGGTWRGALRDSADRLDLPDLRRLALALDRGQRLGAPVADLLHRLARDVPTTLRVLSSGLASRLEGRQEQVPKIRTHGSLFGFCHLSSMPW